MVIEGTPAGDNLVGTQEDDIINGYAGDDVLDGIVGSDKMYGGEGNDLFRFSGVRTMFPAPADGMIDGGAGFDVIDLTGVSPASLNASANGLFVTVGNQRYIIINVEGITFGGGNDYISIPLRTEPRLELRGGSGSDDIHTSGNVAVFGDAGDDRFFVSSSISSGVTSGHINGGSGVDTLRTNIAFTVDLQASIASAFSSTYSVSSIENVELTAYYGQAAAYGDDAANKMSVWFDTYSGGYGVTMDGRGGDDIVSGTRDGDRLYGGSGADTLSGLAGDDRLFGGEGDDILVGGADADVLDGGSGRDSVSYNGFFRSYAALTSGGVTTLRGGAAEDSDTLTAMEHVAFKDGVLQFDPDAAFAQVIRAYHTVLGRAPDALGVDFYVDRMEDRGVTLAEVANDLAGSSEFQAATGQLTNAEFVDYVYRQALGSVLNSLQGW